MPTRDFVEVVRQALDALIQSSSPYQGLFPSVLDRDSLRMPDEIPAPIPGQRKGDRSYPGSNLIHDEPTLKTAYALSIATGSTQYSDAADAYLSRFATHCTNTPNGLFPWGEHAYWDLLEDRLNPGAIHDHLRQAPLWLWEKLWEFNPECVVRFGEGLDYHWAEGGPLEYCRHAEMETLTHGERHGRSCDFPRHGGFYIFDWAFAYLKTGRHDFQVQIQKMLDYWWPRRDATGLLPQETRTPEEVTSFYNVDGPGQTLGLAVGLLDSAELLADVTPELAATMRKRAEVYLNGFLSAPHDLAAGVYVLSCRKTTREIMATAPIWGSVYGIWPASYMALSCLRAYRATGDARLIDWAISAGERYSAQAIPEDAAVPSMDVGLAIGLLADLYDITDEHKWLDAALGMGHRSVEYFFDKPLLRGAIGIDWYESQMGPGFLLHGLARTALLAQDRETCPLSADYTSR